MSGNLDHHFPTSHQLREYLTAASYVGGGNITFRDIVTHSSRCGPGRLFVALAGSEHRGGQFLREAARQKACGILTDFPLPDLCVPQCVVRDVRKTYGELCQAMADHPADDLSIVGVTGTNGKTTVSWMLRAIFRAAGHQTGLLGTVEYDDGVQPPESASLTTPDAEMLAEWMARMKERGTTHLAMEVSSHALVQRRIAGIRFRAAILTNITRDHLDYHGSFEAYQQAKTEIVKYCHDDAPVVVNGDDPGIGQLLQSDPRLQKTNLQTIGFQAHNRIRIDIERHSLQGAAFCLTFPEGRQSFEILLPGEHNILNATQAICAARACGCDWLDIRRGLKMMSPPPGRIERIECGQNFTCLIDYAHTPDAIEQVLRTLRPLVNGRLICLFGAGGNRDREKRPQMGQAACLADVVILTADNSRSEKTEDIINDILSGFPPGRRPDCIEADRAAAIEWGVAHAKAGDCLLLMGKGHETSQEFAEETVYFDDAEQARGSINKYHPSNSQPLLRKTA